MKDSKNWLFQISAGSKWVQKWVGGHSAGVGPIFISGITGSRFWKHRFLNCRILKPKNRKNQEVSDELNDSGPRKAIKKDSQIKDENLREELKAKIAKISALESQLESETKRFFIQKSKFRGFEIFEMWKKYLLTLGTQSKAKISKKLRMKFQN